MRAFAFAALVACAGLASVPCWAQSGSGNKAVHNWNTNAFSKTPPANTNAFSKTPPANTRAFGAHQTGNTNALGTENGGKVTAFGDGHGPTTNAFGNSKTATNNARRLAGSFGTGNDTRASPMGPNAPGYADNGLNRGTR